MNLIKEVIFVFRIIPVILKGWAIKIYHGYCKFAEFWSEKSPVAKLLFVFLLVQLATSAVGWVDYTVNFNQVKENISVSVKSNIFFILASLLNFFFAGFWRSVWVKYIFYISQCMCAVVFFIGLVFSDFAFVEFLKKSDYEFNAIFYVFTTSWFLNTGLFIFSESDDVGLKV